ncbi:MAG: DoxX family protein [Phycisphaerales bacterium]|nr:DoxX family protein [Phycisphaerales bacterium]
MALVKRLAVTTAPKAVVLIRLLVGGVFLSEGVQKFLFPGLVGAGRFAKIGIPYPGVTGPVVGAVEIAAGLLVLVGLLTRPAAASLLVVMLVAIVSTKLPVLVGHPVWGFALPNVPMVGVWGALHEARADLSMILCLLFLLVAGAGRLSADHRVASPGRGGHAA